MSSATNHPERAFAPTARETIADESEDRGRDAQSPTDIPVSGLEGRVRPREGRVKRDHAVLLAAGVAFFDLLAMVPALVALLSIYGLFANRARIEKQLVDSLAAAPQEVRNLISQRIKDIGDASPSSPSSPSSLASCLPCGWPRAR